MTEIKQPKIRFKGFTDNWEECKLGDLIIKNSLRNKDLKVSNVESISNKTGFTKQTEQFNDYSVASSDLSNYYVISENNFAYNPSRINVGSIGYKKCGEPISVISPLYISFYTTNDLNDLFLWYWFKTDYFNRQRQLFSEGGVRDTLSFNKLVDMKITIPKNEEQELIGEYFEELDIQIKVLEQKLEVTKQFKQTMLKKMFPKNGKTKPEIRFKGFTEDWKECKLGEHAEYRRGSFPQPYGNKEWYGGDNAMPFVQVVDVGNDLKLVEDTKQKISEIAQPKSVFVPKGKILVTLQGSIGRVAITQYDCYVDRTILIFDSYKELTDSYFWSYAIQLKFNIEKEKAPGGTIKTITKEALSNFDVSITNIEEQKKIGEFFKTLDDTIAIHQQKLKILKEMKKTMLKKMFI